MLIFFILFMKQNSAVFIFCILCKGTVSIDVHVNVNMRMATLLYAIIIIYMSMYTGV